MFKGAVLDGPFFGENLECERPVMCIAKPNRIACSFVSASTPSRPHEISHFEYRWDPQIKAWRLRK